MSRKLTPEEREYRALVGNVREVAKTRAGQEVIWQILSYCDLYADINISNAVYYEGKRSVGLAILGFLEDADPTLYARLLLAKQQLKGFLDDDGNDDSTSGDSRDNDSTSDDSTSDDSTS